MEHLSQNPLDATTLNTLFDRIEALMGRVEALETQRVLDQARIRELEAQAELSQEKITLLEAENKLLKAENKLLRTENEELKSKLYGPSSERSSADKTRPERKTRSKNDAKAQRKRRKNREARQALVASEEVVHPLAEPDTCQACGGSTLVEMKSSDSIEWDYIPGKWVKRVHKRQTCICEDCKHIERAVAPPRPSESSPYGAGLMAHVVISKVGDHTPLYRQVKQFDRLGIPMNRSTLVGLFARTASLLMPIYTMFLEHIKASDLVLADETPVKMQGQKSKAYMWVFASISCVAYVFSANRSGTTPQKVLGGSPGILVCDGYTGYNVVAGVDGRERGGCNCHARRKFDVKDSPARKVVFEWYRQIYQVEREAKEAGIEGTPAHLELREARSAPVMDEFKVWLEANRKSYGPKEPIGKAIGYALKQWEELTLFLRDPKVPPDNNQSERLMRPIALGRKNWLFTGNVEGGENLAIIASVLATCELAGVNPQTYIQDLLLRLQTHPASKIEQLHPAPWLEHFGHLYPHSKAHKQT